MEIITQKIGENYVIKLRGELDVNTAESVEKALDEVVRLEPVEIQIDCQELQYISSRGLGVFISRFQEIKDKQIAFFLFNMSDQIRYVFRVLGLEELIDIRPSSTVVN